MSLLRGNTGECSSRRRSLNPCCPDSQPIANRGREWPAGRLHSGPMVEAQDVVGVLPQHPSPRSRSAISWSEGWVEAVVVRALACRANRCAKSMSPGAELARLATVDERQPESIG